MCRSQLAGDPVYAAYLHKASPASRLLRTYSAEGGVYGINIRLAEAAPAGVRGSDPGVAGCVGRSSRAGA